MKYRGRWVHFYCGRSITHDEPFHFFLGVDPLARGQAPNMWRYTYALSIEIVGGRMPYFQRFYNHGWSIEVDRIWSGAWTGRYWEVVGWIFPWNLFLELRHRRVINFTGIEWRIPKW